MRSCSLVAVKRGKITESTHRGSVAVVDHLGVMIASVGDSGMITYMRSAAKPVQGVAVLENIPAESLPISTEEIALMVSSHSGEDEHVHIGQHLMAKIALKESDLCCGTHFPLNRSAANELVKKSRKPDVWHCSCSGKHLGMLALAKYMGYPLKGYYLPDHPVQQIMLKTLAGFTDLVPNEIILGTDGCGVPVFGMSLEKMALAFARLVRPVDFKTARKKACDQICQAMRRHPVIVAGEGCFTTDLILRTGGKIIAKEGNEGIFCLGVPEKGWGVAVKIDDGSTRAVAPVVMEVLRQLDLLSAEEQKGFGDHLEPKIINHRKENIGSIKAEFKLQKMESRE